MNRGNSIKLPVGYKMYGQGQVGASNEGISQLLALIKVRLHINLVEISLPGIEKCHQ